MVYRKNIKSWGTGEQVQWLIIPACEAYRIYASQAGMSQFFQVPNALKRVFP